MCIGYENITVFLRLRYLINGTPSICLNISKKLLIYTENYFEVKEKVGVPANQEHEWLLVLPKIWPC